MTATANHETNEPAALEKIVNRIRKLLKLATSPERHEAEAAAEQAAKLIRRYQLSAEVFGSDLMDATLSGSGATTMIMVILWSAGRACRWREILAQGVAKACSVAVTVNLQDREVSIVVAGQRRDVQLAGELWYRLEELVNHHASKEGRKRTSFALGMAAAIHDRLVRGLEQANSEAAAATTSPTPQAAPDFAPAPAPEGGPDLLALPAGQPETASPTTALAVLDRRIADALAYLDAQLGEVGPTRRQPTFDRGAFVRGDLLGQQVALYAQPVAPGRENRLPSGEE